MKTSLVWLFLMILLQKNTELSNDTKPDVNTEPVEIEIIREIEKQQDEELSLLLYYMNIIIDTYCL